MVKTVAKRSSVQSVSRSLISSSVLIVWTRSAAHSRTVTRRWSRSWRIWLSQMLSRVPTLAPSQLPCGVTYVSIVSRMPISMMMPSSNGRLLTCSLVMVRGGAVMPLGYHSTARTWHLKYAKHKLMTSGTGWRETARMSAKSTFAPKPWPLSRIVRRMLIPFSCGVEGSERRVVLPRGLADCRAHHDLEDLVLAEARCPCCGDVVVGDLVGVLGDLVDQRAQRLGEPCVVERGAALGVRRPAVSFFYPRDQRFACLCDIRHAVLPSSYSLKRAT